MARPTSLAVIPLAHPVILLPAARVTVSVSRNLGEHLLALFDESEAQPVVAAVPLITNQTTDNHNHKTDSNPVLSEWATAARVIRIVRPPPRNPRHPFFVTLQGLSRIHLTHPATQPAKPFAAGTYLDSLLTHTVEYLDDADSELPTHENVEVFKAASLRLLDRLAKDALQPTKRDAWVKVAAMVEDVEEHRAAWLADVLVAAVNGEYEDKMGECQFHVLGLAIRLLYTSLRACVCICLLSMRHRLLNRTLTSTFVSPAFYPP